MLMNEPYNQPEEVANQIAPLFADAMLAHLTGDEIISDETNAVIQTIAGISPDLAQILAGLYSDLPPADNNLVIDLN